jgi:hypothetical protein
MPVQKVSLAKALKLKNRLAQRVSQLQTQIRGANSYIEGAKVDFDAKALYETLKVETDRLTALKAAISNANAPIQATIYRLAEMKGLIAFLRGLDTKKGKVVTGYMGQAEEYVSQIGAAEAEAEAVRLEAVIDELQDALDAHNASVSIDVDVAAKEGSRG